jgi:hypothetical protein
MMNSMIRATVVTAAVALTLALVPAPGQSAQRGGRGRGGRGGDEGPPPAPTPRWEDGKPVMGSVPGDVVSGWSSALGDLTSGQDTEDIPFMPWSLALYEMRQIDQLEPHIRCKPSGGARQFVTPYGTEFVEIPELETMYILDNGGPNTYRTVYLDGRDFPEDLEPTYYGYSIGHWEGDTLVVETRGLNEKFWMDRSGTPHTEQLRYIEHFTRLDMETMEYQVTIDDPGAYTRPWTTTKFTMRRRPGDEPFEYICQQNDFAPELAIGTQEDVDQTRFFIP